MRRWVGIYQCDREKQIQRQRRISVKNGIKKVSKSDRERESVCVCV